jgi:hypothetical protein
MERVRATQELVKDDHEQMSSTYAQMSTHVTWIEGTHARVEGVVTRVQVRGEGGAEPLTGTVPRSYEHRCRSCGAFRPVLSRSALFSPVSLDIKMFNVELLRDAAMQH